MLRGVTEPPGVPRGVAGVSRESAGCSWNTKPVALRVRGTKGKQGGRGVDSNRGQGVGRSVSHRWTGKRGFAPGALLSGMRCNAAS